MARAYRFRGRNEVEALAIQFREQRFTGQVGPIDPEVVIEHDLHIEIVPRIDLALKSGTPGWLSCDGRHIFVDAGLQRDAVSEYFALLLHETGHALLHKSLLPKTPPRDPTSFMEFHAGLGEVLVTQLELEAQQFGLFVLMPTVELDPVFADAVELARDRFPKLSDAARLFITTRVAEHFDASVTRVGVRLHQGRLWRRLRESDGILKLIPYEPGALRWADLPHDV